MLQPENNQRPHKVSFYLEKDKASRVMKALSESLKKRGVRVGSRIESFVKLLETRLQIHLGMIK